MNNDPEEEPVETYSVPYSLSDYSLCYRYSGIPMSEYPDMDIYEYRIILINAIVQEANKTEEGRQMLQDYHRIYECDNSFDSEGVMKLQNLAMF